MMFSLRMRFFAIEKDETYHFNRFQMRYQDTDT